MNRRAFLASVGTGALAGCAASGEDDEPRGAERVSVEVVPISDELVCFEDVSVIDHRPQQMLFSSRTELKIELVESQSVIDVIAEWTYESNALLGSNEDNHERLGLGDGDSSVTLEYSRDIEQITLTATAIGVGKEMALLEIEYQRE